MALNDKKEAKSEAENYCICGHLEHMHWGNALGHCKTCSCWGFRRQVIRSLGSLSKKTKLQ